MPTVRRLPVLFLGLLFTALTLGCTKKSGDAAGGSASSAGKPGSGIKIGGRIFVLPGTDCYEGMIIGEHAKDNDLVVNASREKKLTNVRASGTDEAVKLVPIKPFTLEQALDWINDDECVEVTPKSIRIRCRELDPHKRKKKASAE